MQLSIPEIIRAKRDHEVLPRAAIEYMVAAMVGSPGASDSQIAAFAMATLLNGMTDTECADLTVAMTRSGQTLNWQAQDLPGLCLDKHSTGGVGDKVSLFLAPMLAACGAFVPMISGRGLGHTGGTLDKLESIPGYSAQVPLDKIYALTRACGCLIVSPTADLAPADARLYAIRDVTATVESIALVTASILSKKLAAGVDHLVVDVKVGSGAFTRTRADARVLARSIVNVAAGACLSATAWVTDMDQVLGHTAGNALEVREAIAVLCGTRSDARLIEVALTLGAELLLMARLANDPSEARRMLQQVLADGSAAERFERMVAALGGPRDLLGRESHYLAQAPTVCDVLAARPGYVQAMDVRALGQLVVKLGGGRESPGADIDPRVGLSEVLPLGSEVSVGQPLARVHAQNAASASGAITVVQEALKIGALEPDPVSVVYEKIVAHG